MLLLVTELAIRQLMLLYMVLSEPRLADAREPRFCYNLGVQLFVDTLFYRFWVFLATNVLALH